MTTTELEEQAQAHLTKLQTTAQMYGELDAQIKELEKQRTELRGDLLSEFTEYLNHTVDYKTIEVYEDDLKVYGTVHKYVAKFYPDYTVDALETHDGANYRVTIVENPELKKFTFVYDGKKYGRTYSLQGADFDVEGFYEFLRNPGPEFDDENFDAMFQELDKCIGVKQVWTFDEAAAQEAVDAYPEALKLFERFTSIGKPSARLTPITAARNEEVD